MVLPLTQRLIDLRVQVRVKLEVGERGGHVRARRDADLMVAHPHHPVAMPEQRDLPRPGLARLIRAEDAGHPVRMLLA